MLKKPLRRILRIILFSLARTALQKHRPTVVAIVGEGKTGIIREAIYAALKERFPVRRNLEAPNAEFVLPLAVLGITEYPLSIGSWVATLLRSIARLLLLPSHSHILILEIEYTRKESFDYFWNIAKPKVLVICGPTPFLSPTQTAPQIIRVAETPDLSGYMKAALRVAEGLGIPRGAARQNLQNFDLPKARINILPAKHGGLLVDATYQYFPANPQALDEVLEALPGKKIFLSPKQKVSGTLKIKKGEVAILTGPHRKMWTILARLTRSPWT